MQHRRGRFVRKGALVIVLAATPWSDALAQTATPASRGIPDDSTAERAERRLLQYRELSRAAYERLERSVLLGDADERTERALLIEAERHARGAVELMPDSAHGYFLVAAALGLRAKHESVRQRVRLATEIHALADAALERDPDHAGAHHLMGRLHLEAARASGMTRLIATHLFGSTVMRRASWQDAESHLRRAAALEPGHLVHRLWLARLFAARNEEDDARAELEAVIAAEARSDLDRAWQREAADALEDLE